MQVELQLYIFRSIQDLLHDFMEQQLQEQNEDFSLPVFNALASWLGHSCRYNRVAHANNASSYHRDTNVTCE